MKMVFIFSILIAHLSFVCFAEEYGIDQGALQRASKFLQNLSKNSRFRTNLEEPFKIGQLRTFWDDQKKFRFWFLNKEHGIIPALLEVENDKNILECKIALRLTMIVLLVEELRLRIHSDNLIEDFIGERSDGYILDIEPLYMKIFFRPNDKALKLGDSVYVFGHPKYLEKFPTGSAMGENLLVVGFDSKNGPLFL